MMEPDMLAKIFGKHDEVATAQTPRNFRQGYSAAYAKHLDRLRAIASEDSEIGPDVLKVLKDGYGVGNP
jgi:hypothetical protein